MTSTVVVKWPTSERVRDAQTAEFARRFLMGEATAREVRTAVTPTCSTCSTSGRS